MPPPLVRHNRPKDPFPLVRAIVASILSEVKPGVPCTGTREEYPWPRAVTLTCSAPGLYTATAPPSTEPVSQPLLDSKSSSKTTDPAGSGVGLAEGVAEAELDVPTGDLDGDGCSRCAAI